MAHGDITHIDIPVSDLDRGAAFYSALFGWQIAEVPGYEGYPMWRAPNEISGGGLMLRDGNVTSPRSYVEVDSIDEVLATVQDQGGTVVMPKSPISETSWMATFQDPDGNVIGVYEGATET
ncbi:VOC family protein [Aeromicrobium wangtongii]|uniref:VOC family protein n=1 Tax=Aeromicrobium wangtongii TaxID=2969247 RepID=UPI0020180C58|nr:VOC family protein [Aeromicrobium wangtongii]MCL3818665.1 VOC family protein [Aeromicrobium wangtongii]